MKLQSFALQSKSNPKSKPSKNFADSSSSSQINSPEFVSEFDPTKNPNSAPKKASVIPPKENEWRPHKKMKNLELPPLHSGNKPLDFELEDPEAVAANDSGSSMAFGLNLRQSNGKSDDLNRIVNASASGSSNGGSSIDAIMIKQFKSDLEVLPEQQGFDEYDDMPVDGYGAALLAGYGWREGRGIGKNAKDDVKIVEYKRRSAKEGIGFMADHPPATNSAATGGGGNGGSGGGNGGDKGKENVRKSDVFGVGKEVRVVSGDMVGLKGRVVEVLGAGLVVLDGSELGRETVRVDEIAELGSVEEEKCLKKLKELKIRDDREKRGDRRRESGDRDREKSTKREGKRSRDHVVRREETTKTKSSSNAKRVLWLESNIRVRVISKGIKGGKFYLKKGVVVDVIGPGLCDLSMDDGKEIVRGVDQDVLETALPRRGGPVLVLFGKRKGVYGKLVEKDSEKEIGVVQDGDTLEMFDVKLDEIAEYLGDPSLLGY